MDAQQNRHLGQQIKETNAFSGKSLFLGILASLVCTAIIPALGAGRIATVTGAALSPMVVAVITTQGAGLIRSAGVVALSAVALVISIGGFTLPEAIAGHGSLTADGTGTFVDTERDPAATPTSQPKKTTTKPETTQPPKKTETTTTLQPGLRFEVPAVRQCAELMVGEAESCNQIGLRNVGAVTIQVATSDLQGDQAADFVLTKVCNGTLKPGTACSVRLKFRPTAAGVRVASFVVRVSPGGIVRRVTITGHAIDTGEITPPAVTPPPFLSTEQLPPAVPAG